MNQVSFVIDKTELAFVNAQLKTVTKPCDFDLMEGDKTVRIDVK